MTERNVWPARLQAASSVLPFQSAPTYPASEPTLPAQMELRASRSSQESRRRCAIFLNRVAERGSTVRPSRSPPADPGAGRSHAGRVHAIIDNYAAHKTPQVRRWLARHPLPPKAWSGTGRPPSRMRRGPEHNPLSAKALAQDLPAEAWHSITWREGSNVDLASRFAAVRVRPASRDYNLPGRAPRNGC